jgi:hypothetical protein
MSTTPIRGYKQHNMLPTTLTLNVGSPAADVTFTKSSSNIGKKGELTAPSPNNDLQGEILLQFASETTSRGEERTKLGIIKPILKDGEYDRPAGIYVVLTRERDIDVQVATDLVEMLREAMADTDVIASLVAGRP